MKALTQKQKATKQATVVFAICMVVLAMGIVAIYLFHNVANV